MNLLFKLSYLKFRTNPGLYESLKGHSQLCDRADLDTTFVSFEKSLPQPEIK